MKNKHAWAGRWLVGKVFATQVLTRTHIKSSGITAQTYNPRAADAEMRGSPGLPVSLRSLLRERTCALT